jgi:hypothetical protein
VAFRILQNPLLRQSAYCEPRFPIVARDALSVFISIPQTSQHLPGETAENHENPRAEIRTLNLQNTKPKCKPPHRKVFMWVSQDAINHEVM